MPTPSERSSHDANAWPRRRWLKLSIVVGAQCILASLTFAPRANADDGRPTVVLDHLDFPEQLGARRYERHLERQLKREAREVDWGASKDSVIQYRFTVQRLSVAQKGSVLTVTCAAVGRLPGGRSAVSQLSFSGHPEKRDDLVKHVLAIVARGVLTRLAELERVRRGKDRQRSVSSPNG